MDARPKLSNHESDILQMQQDFLSGKISKSSTQVVQVISETDCSISSIKASTNKTVPKPSLFARKSGLKSEIKTNDTALEFTKLNVLRDVVEKNDLSESSISYTFRRPAFPEIFQVDKSVKIVKGKSIFSQQSKKATPDPAVEINSSPQQLASTANMQYSFGECSSISKKVLGDTEANKIHQENIEKLSSLSKEEIEHEQHLLMQHLDPKLIAFLKSKKTERLESIKPATSPASSSPMEIDTEQEVEPEVVKELKNNTWLHMDKVEKEKNKWMTSLPPIQELKGKPFQARFDFHGTLLLADVDLPVQSALYHHGDEPERAGYSVNELLLLSRSSNIQQRVMALNILGKVMEQARLGTYDCCFEAPLISTLLDNEILPLLRYCIDDNTPAVVSAAIVAFSNFISCPFEETCLDRTFLWYGGEEQPDLCSRIKLDEQDKEQEEEMKDDEMAKFDVIKACFRMDVHLRIRYILEDIRPEPRAILAALSILTRIARHSVDSARLLLNFPRLFNFIFKSFLPKDWQTLSQAQGAGVADTIYEMPVRQALRLARVISSWNPDLAQRLVNEFSLLESIKIYVAMETANLRLPTQEGLLLVLDCYHTWRTLLRQGVGVEDFIDLYPVWITQLRYFQTSVSIAGASQSSNVKFSHQLGAAMLLMMEAFVGVCCRLNSGLSLHFGQVGGLREIIEMCVAKWSWQLRQSTESIHESSACLLAAAFHFLATFYAHWVDSQTCSYLDQFCVNHILPLFHLETMNELANRLTKHSNLISDSRPFIRCSESLPSLNAITLNGKVVPVLATSTPFPLLTSIFRLLRIWQKKSPEFKMIKCENPKPYLDYLQRIAASSTSLSNNWFTRYEIWFIHELMMLYSSAQNVAKENKLLLHKVALAICSNIPTGHTHVAAEWMANIIFDHKFLLKEDDNFETSLQQLHLSESKHQLMLSKTLENLDKIADFYVKQFYTTTSQPSQLVYKPLQIFSNDWIYAPLVSLYEHYENNKVKFSDTHQEMTLRSLQAAFIFFSARTSWFFRIRPAEHYARLACVFLASNDLFLNEEICEYAWPILRGLSTHQLIFNTPIEGVQDFLSFYEQLIQQFEAVSYGSSLFGAFLLLPTRQKEPLSFRLKLWCEHPDAIRCLSINSQMLSAPIQEWLEPVENSDVLLRKYAASIKTGIVTLQRNPAIYEIISHHLKSKK